MSSLLHEDELAQYQAYGPWVKIVRRAHMPQDCRDTLALRIRQYRRAGYIVQVRSSSTDIKYAPLWVETRPVGERLIRRAEYYMRP